MLAAALAGEAPGDAHLDAAVVQLMADSEALTRSLLGSNGDAAGNLPSGPPPGPYRSAVRFAATYEPPQG